MIGKYLLFLKMFILCLNVLNYIIFKIDMFNMINICEFNFGYV